MKRLTPFLSDVHLGGEARQVPAGPSDFSLDFISLILLLLPELYVCYVLGFLLEFIHVCLNILFGIYLELELFLVFVNDLLIFYRIYLEDVGGLIFELFCFLLLFLLFLDLHLRLHFCQSTLLYFLFTKRAIFLLELFEGQVLAQDLQELVPLNVKDFIEAF